MKKLKQVLIIVAIIGFALPSCKKGENDPFISLLSRKARISGDWELKSGTITESDNSGAETTTYSGTTVTTSSGTSPYTEKWSIKRNGDFAVTINDDGDVMTINGYWSFGNKVKGMDLKNKESVICWITSESYVSSGGSTNSETYTGTSCPVYTFMIDQLKNKEMIIKYDGTDTWSTNFDKNVGTMTYAQ